MAFPSSNGTSAGQAQVCGDGCPKATQANSVVACGHMYLDGGEELVVGAARDNYLTFFAQTSSGVRPVLGHAAGVAAPAVRRRRLGAGAAVLAEGCAVAALGMRQGPTAAAACEKLGGSLLHHQ